MRKIILDLAVTLDGYIEGPNGEIDWLTKDQNADFGDILNNILTGVDAIFYGRRSYELWGDHQPDEKATPKLKAAYKLLHSKTKYVFSATENYDADGVITISSNIKNKVQEILQQPGENIWLYGGGKLTTTFVNLDLIDVYRLAVYPVVIGSGKLLFSGIENRIGLSLVDVKSSKSGVLGLTYERNR